MFNTIKEFAEAMLEGRVFKHKDTTLYFNPSVEFTSKDGGVLSATFNWYVYSVVEEVILPK